MVSNLDYRKSIRFEHKSTVMLADEHYEYFSYVHMVAFRKKLRKRKNLPSLFKR
jgi:hypothetical protein